MDHGLKLHPDGTLEITLPRGKKVGRVLVCEAGTQDGSLYYPENNVPDITDCTDCIKHGGDWECDRVHCRKGTKQQATKASDCISRQVAIDALYAFWSGSSFDGEGYDIADKSEDVLSELPSAEPEQPSEIQDILDYLDTALHPIISPEHWNVYSELHDMISTLPSAEPEIVTCKECKHRGEEPIADGRYWCEVHNTFMYYCSDAERRTDE